MKKTLLYGLASMFALSFAACDNYEEPNPTPQTNAQEAVFKASEVTITNALNATGAYNLTDLSEKNQNITVATIASPALPSGYDYGVDLAISADNFATAFPVDATVSPSATEGMWDITINPTDLNEAYYNNITKHPETAAIQTRFLLKTVCGNQYGYIGGLTNYYGPYSFSMTPIHRVPIESAYYLVSNSNNWSVAQAIKMDHSGNDPYVDPVFTLMFEVTKEQADAGFEWKIIPQSTYAAGSLVNGEGAQWGLQIENSHALDGKLAPMTISNDGAVDFTPYAGVLRNAGEWILSINVEQGTYQFIPKADFLYTPGDSNNWNQTASQLLSTSDYVHFNGYAHLKGSFKFTNAPDWEHINYGLGNKAGSLSTDGGAGNLSAPEDALYWCNVNIAALTYELAQIKSYGLIGNATPGGWDADTNLTPSADFLVWTGTVELKEGAFKFRANGGWDINLGGDMQNLTPGGADIASPGAGTYEIKLDLSKIPYSCTLTKK